MTGIQQTKKIIVKELAILPGLERTVTTALTVSNFVTSIKEIHVSQGCQWKNVPTPELSQEEYPNLLQPY